MGLIAYASGEAVLAARAAGASDWWIITRHLLPNNASHIIVVATLAIPYMILGETALSLPWCPVATPPNPEPE